MTSVYGLGAGASAVLFQISISLLWHSSFGELAQQSAGMFLAGSLVVITLASLAVGYLLTQFCPQASGSGIPQVKLAFWKEFGYIPWRVAWVKFVAGAASVGGGCSLGREGPSVQLAGGVASNLAGLMGEPKQRRRSATAAGAAAGLAAAFNTPIAAVTFVLEEIVGDLNSRFLGGVLLASLLGAFVVHGVLGKQPAFTLTISGSSSWHAYAAVPLVAAIASVVGVTFQQATLWLRGRRKEFQRVPPWLRPVLGGWVTWVLGSGVFLATGHLGVFGLGYEDLSAALANELTWKVAAVLLLTKWLATVACYGLGGCGGIFSPSLCFGGFCGVAVAGLLSLAAPLSSTDVTMLAVVGMSACLGAVVGAPITSILIVFEMTHEFNLVPPLMVAALISQAISRRLREHNFYDALLKQDGHNLEHVMPPRDLRTWQQLPVSAIANFQPVVAKSLDPEALKTLLRSYPYNAFPVWDTTGPRGILTRKEAQEALVENREPQLEPPVVCRPTQTIRELQGLLIESPVGMVLVTDGTGEKLLGLVTLHDLLRAEVAMAEAVREE